MTLPQLASRHGIHPNLLRKWKTRALQELPKLFADDQQDQRALKAEHQRLLDEPYGEIGRLTTQLAWLKKIWPGTWPALNAWHWWTMTSPT